MDNSRHCNHITKPPMHVIFRNSSGTVNSKGEPVRPGPVELQVTGKDGELHKFVIPVGGLLELSASKSLQFDILRLPQPTKSVGTMTDFTEHPNLTLAELRQLIDEMAESPTLNATSLRESDCILPGCTDARSR